MTKPQTSGPTEMKERCEEGGWRGETDIVDPPPEALDAFVA